MHTPTTSLKARTVASLSETIVPPVRFLGWARDMEVQYAEILYVELKRNIHIPYEWPIQGIERLVLYLVEEIISDFGSPYILQVNNVPAKLIRRGCVYVFEKVPHEKVEGSHLYDVVLPIDDREIRMEIFSGENQEYCATALTSEKEMPLHHTIPSCLKRKLRSTANDPVSRHCMVRRIKRIFKWAPKRMYRLRNKRNDGHQATLYF